MTIETRSIVLKRNLDQLTNFFLVTSEQNIIHSDFQQKIERWILEIGNLIRIIYLDRSKSLSSRRTDVKNLNLFELKKRAQVLQNQYILLKEHYTPTQPRSRLDHITMVCFHCLFSMSC